eukprot:scaffold12435_cov69-Phaeocystis_antarctica.AAC.1
MSPEASPRRVPVADRGFEARKQAKRRLSQESVAEPWFNCVLRNIQPTSSARSVVETLAPYFEA